MKLSTPEEVRRYNFVAESNRIESIDRDPTQVEIDAHEQLWSLDRLTVADIEAFVADVAGRPLRRAVGQNVIVGSHRPPSGGPEIEPALAKLLDSINDAYDLTPWQAHCDYETLHPFVDGNGRSGRAIWAWQMMKIGHDPFRLGFLHTAYYQALDASSSRRG